MFFFVCVCSFCVFCVILSGEYIHEIKKCGLGGARKSNHIKNKKRDLVIGRRSSRLGAIMRSSFFGSGIIPDDIVNRPVIPGNKCGR